MLRGFEAFDSCVNHHAERYVRALQELCRQPSVSLHQEGMDEAAAVVIRMLREIGCRVSTFTIEGSHPIIVGEVGEGPRTLMIYNHYDVQPPDPLGKWESGPFAAIIRGDALFARGAADNKGNFVARVAAVDAYQRVFKSLPLQLIFVLEGEEEIGSPHLEVFVDRHRDHLQADACLWETGYKDAKERHTICLGLKGYCALELRARGARTELHSSWGTVIENPAWRLAWALGTLLSPDHRILVEGLAELVRPPSDFDSQLLHKISFGDEQLRQAFGIDHFLNHLEGMELLKKHFFEPSLTICGWSSGYSGPGIKTILPNSAAVKIEFRLVPDLMPDRVVQLLRAHLDRHGFRDIQIASFGGVPPAKSRYEEPIVQVAVEAAREVYGHDPVIYPLLSGSGPMYYLCQGLGIPAVSVGVGHAGSHIHAPNENIRLADFMQGIKYVGRVIDRYGRMEAPSLG